MKQILFFNTVVMTLLMLCVRVGEAQAQTLEISRTNPLVSGNNPSFRIYSDERVNTIPSFFDGQRLPEKKRPIRYRMAYRGMSFLNDNYHQRMMSKEVTYNWGADLGLVYVLYPFMIDGGFMYSSFSVDEKKVGSYYSGASEKSTSVWGLSTYLSIFPLQDWGIVSQIVRPYFGVGYQTSSISVINNESSNSGESSTLGSYGLGGVMLKAGVTIELGFVGLNTEYRQRLTNDALNSRFSEWVIGLIF